MILILIISVDFIYFTYLCTVIPYISVRNFIYIRINVLICEKDRVEGNSARVTGKVIIQTIITLSI